MSFAFKVWRKTAVWKRAPQPDPIWSAEHDEVPNWWLEGWRFFLILIQVVEIKQTRRIFRKVCWVPSLHLEAACNAAGCWGCFSDVFVHSSIYIVFANQESTNVSFVWLYDPFPYHITLKVTGKTEAQTNRRRVDGFFPIAEDWFVHLVGFKTIAVSLKHLGSAPLSVVSVAAADAVLAIAGCWFLLANSDVILTYSNMNMM